VYNYCVLYYWPRQNHGRWNLPSLYSLCARKKQKRHFHEKLKVPTSERVGKLSNPRGHAARARRARDAWRKFTEIYGNPRGGGAARAPCIDIAAAKNTKQLLRTAP
jgi:hypothetical protein